MRTTRLHPDDIEALASAIAEKLAARQAQPPARAPVVLKQPTSTGPTVADLWRERLITILPTLPLVTTRTALEALGVPPERQDRAASAHVGRALQALGYRPAHHRRLAPGYRARAYEKTGD